MAKLTTHVLNVAAGIPAAGMRIDLHYFAGESRLLAASIVTNGDGRSPEPLVQDQVFVHRRYALTFHVAAYFRSLGVALSEPPFLDEVVIAFGVADSAQNYHVPLLVSPWSYSTYRGS